MGVGRRGAGGLAPHIDFEISIDISVEKRLFDSSSC